MRKLLIPTSFPYNNNIIIKRMTSSTAAPTSIYDFPLKNLRGKDFDNNQLKGKVVLIFNTASKCGLTPQLDGLQKVFDQYKDQGLVVLGFPCNDFAAQEPGNAEEIEQVCQLNYGVKFPIMEKLHVNGNDVHPLYQYLKKEKTFMGIQAVKWNFEKFLIGKDGKVFERYLPTTTPEALIPDIEKLLKTDAPKL